MGRGRWCVIFLLLISTNVFAVDETCSATIAEYRDAAIQWRAVADMRAAKIDACKKEIETYREEIKIVEDLAAKKIQPEQKGMGVGGWLISMGSLVLGFLVGGLIL